MWYNIFTSHYQAYSQVLIKFILFTFESYVYDPSYFCFYSQTIDKLFDSTGTEAIICLRIETSKSPTIHLGPVWQFPNLT